MAVFDDLSASWWDPDGPMQVLHRLNPLRLEFIRSFVKLQGCSVLDIGCGGGLLSEALCRCGAHVLGLDQSQKMIDCARLHAVSQSLSIDYRCVSLSDLYVEHDALFDCVVCLEVLEHIDEDLTSFLKHAVRLLKPGGFLFLSTINRTVKSYVLAIIMAEYILHLLPRGTHHWKDFIKPSELSAILIQLNLSIVHITGLTYNILTHTASLAASVDVNYFMVCQK